jgi:hypothetical protein
MKKVNRMKKNLLILVLSTMIFSVFSPAFAGPPTPPIIPLEIQSEQGGFITPSKEKQPISDMQIEKIYNTLIPCDVTFENGLDPFEQQDNYPYGRSPYPLIRTVSRLYCQKTVIEPGYYLVTPRQLNARYYLLFKQQGKVLYTVPIYSESQINPAVQFPKPIDPYENAPFGLKSLFKLFGIISGRRTPVVKTPDSKVDCFYFNDQYFGINIYYKDRLYKTIYKVKLDE